MHQIFSLTKEEYAQNKNNLISQSVTKGETHKKSMFQRSPICPEEFYSLGSFTSFRFGMNNVHVYL